MADQNHPRVEGQPAAVADEDPFAELARIMGFDPRQPVKQAASVAPVMPAPVEAPAVVEPVAVEALAPAAQPEPAVAEDAEPDFDFGIDLERELFGEFAADDNGPSYEQPVAASAREPEPSFEPEPAHAPVANAAPEPVMDVVSQPSEMQLAAEDAPLADEEPTLEYEAEEADELVLAEDDAIVAQEQPAAVASAPVAEEDPVAEPESEDLSVSLESELALASAVAPALDEQSEPQVNAEPEMLAADLDDDFADTVEAVQTVDEPQQASPNAFQPLPSLSDMRGALPHEEPSQAIGVDDFDADLDLGLSEAFSGIATLPARKNEGSGALALSGLAPVGRDTSLVEGLEDELNALLGNEVATPRPVQQVAATVEAQQDDVIENDDDFWPSEIEPQAASTANAGRRVGDEPEPAMSGQDRFASAPVDQMVAAPQADAPTEDEPEFDDFDLDLDDHAFDAAISDSIAHGLSMELETVNAATAAALTTKEPEPPMSREGNDPYAALAALSANLKNAPSWPEAGSRPVAEPRYQQEAPRYAAAPSQPAYAAQEVPDIDTVDVPEHAVALADDLDLPEFSFEDNSPSANFDDLDAEFANLLNDMKAHEIEPSATANARSAEQRYGYDGAARGDSRVEKPAAPAAAAAPAYAQYYDDEPPAQASGDNREFELSDDEYDPDFDDAIPSAYATAGERQPQRRGTWIAAIVGGVALLGGVGAFALTSGNGGGSGELALVKADSSPVKVKPENPGGTAIPNQTNKVYDSVAGAGAAPEAKQEKLLSSAEEPVDIPLADEDSGDMAATAADEGAMPGLSDEEDMAADATPTTGTTEPTATSGKSEDRLDQAMTDAAGVDKSVEVAAVAPRKVRTMIVKADGTLVAREEPAAPATDMQVASASEGVVDPAASQEAPAPDEVAKPPMATATATAKSMPSAAPIAPPRPADQPVDIVGEVKPERVAALSPAAAGGSWAMQIASQPSEASAQSSYQDLLRRYGNVLEGHQANIVKAEIANKGTYWRVRVPAGSRSDAVQLCERYKGAGGSCFVSK